jgi:hypothetical protein
MKMNLIKCKIRKWLYLPLLFIILIAASIFFENGFSGFINDIKAPFPNGLITVVLALLFIILPIVWIFFLYDIQIIENGLLKSNHLLGIKRLIEYNDIESFKVINGIARGFDFTEINIKLKNGRKININSLSHNNTHKFIDYISKFVKKS